jgi:starch phosphorylase
MTVPEQDELDLNSLYDVLQQQILPLYYENRDTWRQVVKNGMNDVRFQFDSSRMVSEYYEKLYV